SEDDLALIAERAGVDLRDHVDAVTNASEVEESKPDPDVLEAVLDTLDLAPDEALFVGDTVHDAEAARRASVPFVGVTTGVWTEGELREAGARAVFRGPAALPAGLDGLLG